MEFYITEIELYEVFCRKMDKQKALNLTQYTLDAIEKGRVEKKALTAVRLIELDKKWKQLENFMSICVILAILFVLLYTWFG